MKKNIPAVIHICDEDLVKLETICDLANTFIHKGNCDKEESEEWTDYVRIDLTQTASQEPQQTNIENWLPEHIHFKKKDWVDDDYADTIIWEGEETEDDYVNYVRSDITSPQWISVKDSMPEILDKKNNGKYSDDVVVIDIDGCYATAFLSKEENGTTAWVSRDEDFNTSLIKAWMSIPEYKPKE